MKTYIFSGDKKYHDGEMKSLAIIYDGTCIILTGKQKISAGKQQNQGRETLYAQNVAGKQVFLAGHPSTLAGQCFSGVVTGGCSGAGCQNISKGEILLQRVIT